MTILAAKYILSKISWGHQWIWPYISYPLFKILRNEEINSLNVLSYTLNIVQGSDIIADADLAALAEYKCKSITEVTHASYWFSTWIGVDPANAIPYFSIHLGTYEFEVAKNIVMSTIVQLVGERRSGSNARDNYKTPQYLKELYLLTHQYVRMEEDLHRAGKGAYSPTIRDNAQDARSRLFSMLTDIQGKESYLAQMVLAESHPVDSHRAWMLQYARQRARQDAEAKPWTVQQFNEFRKDLERTPRNHRELFELAKQRLLDFKHDCEDGDNSNAQILIKVTAETEMRNYIAGWCRDKGQNRYSVPQEDELADAKRPDIRFFGTVADAVDAPVPIELKLVDNGWSGADLFERLMISNCSSASRFLERM